MNRYFPILIPLVFLLSACQKKIAPDSGPIPTPDTRPTVKQLALATVKITNLQGNSGGTGTILTSNTGISRILTNAHVCNLVGKNGGGLVETDQGNRFPVDSYITSKEHDLCLLGVKSNLGVQSKLASGPPVKYTHAYVSGHPSLLPTLVTEGHFSGHQIIEVMVGTQECTQEDAEGDNAMFCVFLGGIPIIKTYDTQVLSATIMPGSSGSAVYNEAGEISGVVFAGSGELSYAFIVPYTYVLSFLVNEVRTLPEVRPAMTNVGSSRSPANTKAKVRPCHLFGKKPVRDYCKALNELGV